MTIKKTTKGGRKRGRKEKVSTKGWKSHTKTEDNWGWRAQEENWGRGEKEKRSWNIYKRKEPKESYKKEKKEYEREGEDWF